MRRIGVFTATRAEFGLLRPVIAALEASATLRPLVIVSGAHLSGAHGLTVREIEAEGVPVAARVPVPLAGDGPAQIAADMAATLDGCARAYVELGLDAVLMLGDRTELLAAATAAVPLTLPILHLEGGHLTHGAVDDSIRHAVSKLAALHFTAAEPYRARLIQMGEAPERVFTVGSTAADNLLAFGRRTRAEVEAETGLDLSPGFILATFHPETLGTTAPDRQIDEFLRGLEAGRAGRKVLITLPNTDAGSGAVRERIEAWAAANADWAAARASLGARLYLGALTACDAVAGNSSSGVIEAPIAGVPSINVGERQAGRLRPPGVIDAALDAPAIAAAVRQALDPAFRAHTAKAPAPFGDGRAARRIVRVLEATDFAGLARKPFVDRA
ncbi:MAG: UDP-N-acetylglucosamine 2-epimerase (hydrolyzing) [Brevundimonas sp.]|uniref:UDP-N-acetylglucosamine 2-epimerase n=1 Tax=Brevundimonas sp. TaxID=1871086 RepID=UPI0025C62B99|nr:UDP-N-acetylglucosamine 2-epimerase [Brevundimonas sp.]MBX3478348.1 UDP-N-acetylglucosamine 2-epimerase (hydrolyzing) [Brevundimonas sp.]